MRRLSPPLHWPAYGRSRRPTAGHEGERSKVTRRHIPDASDVMSASDTCCVRGELAESRSSVHAVVVAPPAIMPGSVKGASRAPPKIDDDPQDRRRRDPCRWWTRRSEAVTPGAAQRLGRTKLPRRLTSSGLPPRVAAGSGLPAARRIPSEKGRSAPSPSTTRA